MKINLINKFFQKNGLISLVILLLFPTLGRTQINELKFEQLNWLGPNSILVNSSWGQVTIDYLGYETIQFFNLNVNGNWVIKNLGVDSLFGEGVEQKVAAFFGLGVEHGVEVTELDFISYLTPDPLLSIPTGNFMRTTVHKLDFMLGGLDSGDNTIGNTNIDAILNNHHKPEKSAKLPKIEKLKSILQKQGPMECVPGAISNSLKYLQATGKLNKNVKTDMEHIKKIVRWKQPRWKFKIEIDGKDRWKTIDVKKGTIEIDEKGDKWVWIEEQGKRKKFKIKEIRKKPKKGGTSSKWPKSKGNQFNQYLQTINPKNINQVIDAVEEGCDVEANLFPTGKGNSGHAVLVAGIRKYSDKIELDIFDDNQYDDRVDDFPKTIRITRKGVEYVEGNKQFGEVKFVVECPRGCCKRRRIKNFSFSEDELPICYQYRYSESECISQGGFFEEGECSECELLTDLSYFTVESRKREIYLHWKTGSETNNAGFRVWRGVNSNNGSYTNITVLSEFGHTEQVEANSDKNCSDQTQGQLKTNNPDQLPQFISAVGNSVESTCYSFEDTSILGDGTYYYVLEDIDDDGTHTFHCDHIDAVTIGQGLAIDLESAINYCKEVTGSEN